MSAKAGTTKGRLIGVACRCVVMGGALILAGCATQAPVDQIKYFSQAFTAVNTVGQPLLDDLAIAERNHGRQIAERRAKGEKGPNDKAPEECRQDKLAWRTAPDGKSGVIDGFCIVDAGYYADIGDPPSTAALRAGLDLIERYADTLSSLAEGRNVEQALSQVDALGKEVDGLLGLAGGVPAIALAPVLGVLKPFLDKAARQANAAEARRLILEGAPQVTRLIAALRQAAPPLFNNIIRPSTERITRPVQGGSITIDIARIEAYRASVSQYVVLLNRLEKAWENTVDAAKSPLATQGRLAALVSASAELRKDADTVRRGLAKLRTGTGQ